LAPRLGHLEPWTGSVDHAAVSGIRVAHGVIADTAPVATALMDRAPIVITGIGGKETGRLAAIMAITDSDDRELLLVGPLARDLVVRRRRRAQVLRLDAPAERHADLIPARSAGRPFSMEIDDRCAVVDGVRSCLAPPPPGHGWTLLHYRHVPVAVSRVLDALFVALLSLPLAFLAGLGGWRRALGASAALALALTVAALTVGLAPPGWPDLAAILAALPVGRGLIRSLRQSPGPPATSDQRVNMRA
jgi:hypothetical protein